MSRLFDTIVMVDWSGAATPSPAKPSEDAIWLAAARDGFVSLMSYHRTRHDALATLRALLLAERDAGRRVLVGFDFPFGWPRGLAAALTGAPKALALWRWLAGRIEDRPDNHNNRFEVAAAINAALPGLGPFWGRPAGLDIPDLPEKGTARHGAHPPERRHVETRVRSAQPCWKLYTTGSVGSQALLGVAALARLRADPALAEAIAVWPFDTGLQAGAAPVVLAEIYPSLLPVAPGLGEMKDAAQVRATAAAFAALDRARGLAPLFGADADLSPDERTTVAEEEAWILGVGHEAALRAAA